MFEQKLVDEYQAQMAPEGLKSRIMQHAEAEAVVSTKKHRRAMLYMYSRYTIAAAACMLFLFLGVSGTRYMRETPGVEITEPVMAAGPQSRMIENTVIIPMQLDGTHGVTVHVSSGEIEVTNADGSICTSDSVKLKGNTSFCWSLDRSEIAFSELNITSFLKKATYLLEEVDGTIVVIKK